MAILFVSASAPPCRTLCDADLVSIRPFTPFATSLDPSFWAALTKLKIDTLRLDDAPLPCSGSYAAGRTVLDKSTNQVLSLPCSASFTGQDLEAPQKYVVDHPCA